MKILYDCWIKKKEHASFNRGHGCPTKYLRKNEMLQQLYQILYQLKTITKKSLSFSAKKSFPQFQFFYWFCLIAKVHLGLHISLCSSLTYTIKKFKSI